MPNSEAGDPPQHGAGAIAALPQRCSATIDIEKFKHGTDDFSEWVEDLESVISLATNATGDNLKDLCKRWLPLKLDRAAKAIYKQVDGTLPWDGLKTALTKLMIDTNTKYAWQAMQYTIKWDGKESFYALASRVKLAVATYQLNLPEDLKNEQHFFRFREALPEEPYQNAIDLGCKQTECTLENALDIAQRVKMIQVRGEGKSVTFAGAALDENRQSSLETTLSRMESKLDALNHSVNNKFKAIDDRLDKLESWQREQNQWSCNQNQPQEYQSMQLPPPRSSGNQPQRGFSRYGQPPHNSQPPGPGYARQDQAFQ